MELGEKKNCQSLRISSRRRADQVGVFNRALIARTSKMPFAWELRRGNHGLAECALGLAADGQTAVSLYRSSSGIRKYTGDIAKS